MSASSLPLSSPATATTVLESTIPPALFLLVPLFTIALALLALSHRPQQQDTTGGRARPQARVAYAFIALLAVLSAFAGTLPLSHVGSPQAEAVVQALLSSLLAVPVLHLGSTYSGKLLGLVHRSILVTTLSGATLLALLSPFLSTIPQYLPSALFLFYSLLAFPDIAWSLLRFLHPGSTKRTARPITIHISTQRTSLPLSISSSAASFSGTQALAEPKSNNIKERDRPIELAITLQKRKECHRSRFQERGLQDFEKSTEPEAQQQIQKHKHERSLSSASSTSTITAVDHLSRATPNFPLISLTTPPRAAYTSAYIPTFGPTGTQEHLYRFPVEHIGQNNNEDEASDSTNLRTQLIHNRSRSLLVFLLAAQLTLLVGYSCAVGASVSSDPENTVLPLRIVQTACTVLAVTGTMSAYLLHAYNTHLSPSRARASRRNRASTVDAEQPQAQSQMLPTSALPPSATPTPFASLSPQFYPQQSPLLGDPRPALIQIEPPPPPRMRRKRVDAGLGNAIETSLAYSGSASNSTGSSHSHEEFGGQDHGRRSYSGDVPYTYPYSHSRTTSGQYREPIVLEYQPPKVRTPDDASLFEMTEPEEKGLESEGVNAKETDSDLELNLEVEMQKALTLSRTSSVATSRSGLSSRRGHARAAGERKRASASIHAAASRRMSASFQVTTATSKAKAKAGNVRNSKMLIDLPRVSHERNSYVMSQKKKSTTSKEDDPATYIRKRGSIQSAVPQTKKLFGWEFGWDPLPLSSRGARSKSATRSQDADESFIAGEGVARQPTRARKLKKRSKSTLRSANEETFSMPQVADYPLPLPKRTSLPGSEMESPPSSASYNTFGIRRHHARSSSRPGTAESKKNSFESDEALSSNGHVHRHQPQQRPVLNLKRSFKMGIGRTLGPSLSLASVDDERHHQQGRVERRTEKDGTSPSPNEEDLDDVDSEIRSIAAAKLVSASIARVTPAATIIAAPASAARITTPPMSTETTGSAALVSIKHSALMSTPRPVLPAIVTVPTAPSAVTGTSSSAVPFPKSAPATMKTFSIGRSPSSAKAPRTGGSTWRPHPFAESPAKSPMHGSVTAAYLNDVGALSSPEDDVVSLEREMEEIRGSRSGGQNKMDSPTAQFKELAMLMSIPMPESTTLPKPIPSSRKSKGGALEAQKSSPMQSQDDYPYRFPMFFPGSNSNSPPKVQPTSATPRGPGSGLRLSSKTMDTVRNAFAGVRLSMRASMHSTAAGSTKGTANVGERITEDRYGDFMDLCDPFASPPMSASTIAISPVVRKKTSRHGSVTRDGGSKVDEGISEEAEEQVERKMSAWGRLPMPARSSSPGPSSKRPSSGGRVAVRAVGKPSRKHKKDKRSRKSTLPGLTPKPLNALEDADFGFEEALLSQRLLSRLDAHGWESRV